MTKIWDCLLLSKHFLSMLIQNIEICQFSWLWNNSWNCINQQVLTINLVTCKLRTAEIVMANLTHIFFPFVESHTFSSQIGGTWALETFLAFAKFYIFLQKLCFCLNIIKTDLQILRQKITENYICLCFIKKFKWCKLISNKSIYLVNF